ncbi:MAG: hypothetical protein AB1656_16720 [Candidatus Omnitrophota bacterium]
METAKELWRRNNLDREHLPKGFEENIRLALREVREGSCIIPVERIIEIDEESLFGEEYVRDEVDAASEILTDTLIAVEADEPFPEPLPKKIIPLFRDWGKTLQQNESIEIRTNGKGSAPFNWINKERIFSRSTKTYYDKVSLIGEVRAASLKAREGGTFTILTDDGFSVKGIFTPEQESDITAALHNHSSIKLRITGEAEFDDAGQIQRFECVDDVQESIAGEPPFDPTARPIWEQVIELGESVPEEEWDRIPTDLSKNLDHYLYGAKRELD